jgi:aminoglycoside/choline kinase family phosphotransferase
MNELESLFKQYTHEKLLSKEELSASGSNRRYFRLESKNNSLIGVEGTSIEENKAFIEMATHFYAQGLPVPRFIAQTDDGRFYIQEDLGNTLLFDYIAEGRKTGVFYETEKDMLRKTMRKLPAIQVLWSQRIRIFSVCYPPAPNSTSEFHSLDLNLF